eukprot:5887701-Pyramimonas_sp.AAC.1
MARSAAPRASPPRQAGATWSMSHSKPRSPNNASGEDSAKRQPTLSSGRGGAEMGSLTTCRRRACMRAFLDACRQDSA